ALHLAADPDRALLAANGVLHAATAALVALCVALLAGSGWGLAAGLGAALYRPLLVYCGVEEPETAIVFLLALGVFLALLARARLAAWPAAEPAREGPIHPFSPLFFAGLAFLAVTLAGLARPQHLVLLPIWAAWISSAAPRGRRRPLWIAAAAV